MSTGSKMKQYRIDPAIVNLFLLLVIGAGGLLGFKYYKHQPCPSDEFRVLGKDHKVDAMVKFQNTIGGKHEFMWDFGDNTKQAIRRSPVHIFKKAGTYQVTLVIDGRCEQVQNITISDYDKVKPKKVLPKIIGVGSVYADKPLTLSCNKQDCVSYKWYVSERDEPVSFRKDFKYTFESTGYKNVTLIVNEDYTQRAEKRIFVKLPKNNRAKEVVNEVKEEVNKPVEVFVPQTPKSYVAFEDIKKQEPKLKYLPPDEELQVMFINILKGEVDKKVFEEYMCGGANELVVYCNGEVTSFSSLLEEMEGISYVLKEFSTTRSENICISKLTIKYRKRKNFLNL